MSETDQQSDDESDDVKPWTVKKVPPEERNAAIAAAKRDKLHIGPWLVLAIRQKIQSDHQKDRAPVPVTPQSAPQSDLSEVERLIAMAEQLARVSGGTAPKGVSAAGFAILRERLRAARKGSRTAPAESPTASPESQTVAG